MRRLLAGFMLAGLALTYAAPLSAQSAAAACPLAPDGRNSVTVTAMERGSCGHSDAAACVTALGCIAPAPAIQAPGAPVVVSDSPLITVAFPASCFGDLYHTGPPTPPPNLI